MALSSVSKTVFPSRFVYGASLVAIAFGTVLACSPAPETSQSQLAEPTMTSQENPMAVASHQAEGKPLGKPVVYQVFTRLFGNTNNTNKPWGTLEENGVGKFNDFTDEALQGIKELGTTHLWYTGVPHHAVIRNYTEFGISLDDPDVVKGRAGSPYAVKDYYNVNPDLAVDPAHRLAEFEALIARTHEQGMKVLIDIVPNHVARGYQSMSAPEGVVDFGANDDVSIEYARDNNFYYVVGEDFKVPEGQNGYQPLGGDSHPLSDGVFIETPAKWTGNGSRAAQPDANDWYETVKVNYGVKPDGSYDFPTLPKDFAELDYAEHHDFWQGKDLPNSWVKFHDIVHYWLDKGVDGFRYDMAEMVPVEFWSYLNSSIKMKNPDAFLLAEVYQPHLYRDYIRLGKMDYLYDKVEFYDTLKAIMQGAGNTADLVAIQNSMHDIDPHMLHFLENHDEQRIASPEFVGSAEKGMPALVVSALISRSPTMLYFGQDVGENGSEETGFGDPTRTTIFDYAGVPAHQRWMNGGLFDGGQLTESEAALRQFHIDVMAISASHPAMQGDFISLHQANTDSNTNDVAGYDDNTLAFARVNGDHKLIVISQFTDNNKQLALRIPSELTNAWGLETGEYSIKDLLTDASYTLRIDEIGGSLALELSPLGSLVLEL